MGRASVGKALLVVGAVLGGVSSSSASAIDTTDTKGGGTGGGLRRKRSSNHHQYRSSKHGNNNRQQQQQQQVPSNNNNGRGLSEESSSAIVANNNNNNNAATTTTLSDTTTNVVGEDLARRFFLPPSHQNLDDIDMRQLILEMNFDGSMSIIMTPEPTPPPTNEPTQSSAPPSTSTSPTFTSCDNEGTCQNRLSEQIYQVSVRVGTVEALDDPSSPQSKASAWILEECDATVPIDPCTESQLLLNEQRYALAVMYFSLGGDGWNAGSNPTLDKSAPDGQWMSGLNYCDWGTEISGANGSYNQLVCDEFGNVLNLNLRTFIILYFSLFLLCCVFVLCS